MTWPPSCHAASPWSTLTPRTSPSSMKETGWSDVDGRDVKKKKEKAALVAEDKRVQVSPQPPNPALHTSPSKSPFYSGKDPNIFVAHFSSVQLLFFFLSRHISVLLWFEFGEKSPGFSHLSL